MQVALLRFLILTLMSNLSREPMEGLPRQLARPKLIGEKKIAPEGEMNPQGAFDLDFFWKGLFCCATSCCKNAGGQSCP
jgi:hypothetical protein